MQPFMLVDPLTPEAFFEALSHLGISPGAAVRDPVRATRQASTVELGAGNRFLNAVLRRGHNVNLYDYPSEEARLIAAAVLAQLLARARKVRALRRNGYASSPTLQV